MGERSRSKSKENKRSFDRSISKTISSEMQNDNIRAQSPQIFSKKVQSMSKQRSRNTSPIFDEHQQELKGRYEEERKIEKEKAAGAKEEQDLEQKELKNRYVEQEKEKKK